MLLFLYVCKQTFLLHSYVPYKDQYIARFSYLYQCTFKDQKSEKKIRKMQHLQKRFKVFKGDTKSVIQNKQKIKGKKKHKNRNKTSFPKDQANKVNLTQIHIGQNNDHVRILCKIQSQSSIQLLLGCIYKKNFCITLLSNIIGILSPLSCNLLHNK